MGAHRDRGYVTNGLTEEITNELVHLNGIRVAARTSSFAFKKMVLDVREIGAMMNVEAVIEGSIRSQADGLRICAQLVRTSDGFYLWSDTFERNANNIIGVEIEIAKFVAVVLREEIAGAQKK